MTATGMEALTVMPTFSTRYSDDAPKMMPSMRAHGYGNRVSSRIWTRDGNIRAEPGGVLRFGSEHIDRFGLGLRPA